MIISIHNKYSTVEKQIQDLIPSDPLNGNLESGFYLFISIDLVSFTRIKSEKEYPAWKNILVRFYNYIRNEFNNEIYGPCRVWKLSGDEVILKWRIIDIKLIPGLLLEILEHCNDSGFKELIYRKMNIDLQMKVTAWLVEAHPHDGFVDSDENKNIKNISFNTLSYMNNEYQDFVGEQMDVGFRLTKCALPTIIVLSVEIVYVISKICEMKELTGTILDKAKNIIDNIKTVGFRKLKGVGNGAPYPIIWYSSNWDKTQELFLKAEYHEHTLLNNIAFREDPFPPDMYEQSDFYKNITGDEGYIERLIEAGKKKVREQEDIAVQHFAIILFAKKEEKIFIVLRKRDGEKRLYPGLFDFGSAKITRQSTSIGLKIKQEYKKDMGIDLHVNIEEDQPIAVFRTEEHNICGILYTKLLEPADVDKIAADNLYPLDEVLNMQKDKFVPRALENIERAKKLLGL